MDNLGEIKATLKTGNEPLLYQGQTLQYTLLDFWKWSVSDILSNATRGRLAEFIVATATNIDITNVRNEWDAFDLITPEGVKLEIKSAAYLQSWYQRLLSKISFSIKLSRSWDATTNLQSLAAKRHADVYVFCLLKHLDKSKINPLDMDHWGFYIMSAFELNNYKRSQHSITLKSLENLTKEVCYGDLRVAIFNKHKLNNSQLV